jgi:phage terminase large subunit-like protein
MGPDWTNVTAFPYGLWAEQGFLELSPGDVIDYRDVKARVLWVAEMFDVPEMCFDPVK